MDQYKFPEECAELAKAKDIMHFEEITMIDGNNRKQKRILIITSWEFHLFKSSLFTCGQSPLVLTTKFRWIDITKVASPKAKKIFISFQRDKSRFESSLSKLHKKNIPEGDTFDGNPAVGILSSTPQKLLTKIFSYIISFSLETEYPQFFLSPDIRDILWEQSYTDVLNHVNLRMKAEDKTVPFSVVNKIQRFVTKQDPVLKLSKLKNFGPCLNYFLECLHWFQFLKKIVINFNSFRQYMRENQQGKAASKNFDIIQVLRQRIITQNTIAEIEFRDRVPLNFKLLIESIIKANKYFHTAIFVDCDLNASQLNVLKQWIETGTLEYLYLISTISPINGPTFIASLNNNYGAQMLRKINISRLSRLEISSLISYLPRIRYLSLQYCDFELHEFFYLIKNTPTPCQVETVILSGNRNTRRIQPKLQFPPYLREINVSDIFWESESFKNFFQSVLLHQPIKNPQEFDDFETIRNSSRIRRVSTQSQIKSEDDANPDSNDENQNENETSVTPKTKKKKVVKKKSEAEDTETLTASTASRKKKVVKKRKRTVSDTPEGSTNSLILTSTTDDDEGRLNNDDEKDGASFISSTKRQIKEAMKKSQAATDDEVNDDNDPATSILARSPPNDGNEGEQQNDNETPVKSSVRRKVIKRRAKSPTSTHSKSRRRKQVIDRIPTEFDKGDFDDNDNPISSESNKNDNGKVTLRLDMSGAILAEADWKDFFKYVQVMKIKTKLGTLRWNTNKLHKAFFLFLNRCEDLKCLSLDGCFAHKDEVLPFCVAYLSSTKQHIHYMSCAGTNSRWLGKEGSAIFIQFLATNRSVMSLNLSNNHSGAEMFLELSAILNYNLAIQAIQIDGNDIASVSAYRRFFTSLLNRGKPLYIPWPEQEVKDMLQYGAARRDDIEELIELYQLVVNGGTQSRSRRGSPHKKLKKKRTETDVTETEVEVDFPKVEDVL